MISNGDRRVCKHEVLAPVAVGELAPPLRPLPFVRRSFVPPRQRAVQADGSFVAVRDFALHTDMHA